jgi:hypothetical protein
VEAGCADEGEGVDIGAAKVMPAAGIALPVELSMVMVSLPASPLKTSAGEAE